MQKEQFDITGMTCTACAARIEKVLKALPGITEVNVNLLKNSMIVTFEPSHVSNVNIIDAVEKIGYTAKVHAEKTHCGSNNADLDLMDKEQQKIKQRLIWSSIFTLPLFYIAMGHMFHLPLPDGLVEPTHIFNYALTQLLLVLPVIFINAKYYRIGFRRLFSGAPNMDTLIALGSGAAAIFGIYSLYKIGVALGRGNFTQAHDVASNLYFESAAVILTLITLGNYLEERAKGKTSAAINALMALTPHQATVKRNGKEIVIPREKIVVDDSVIVKTGERIVADGIVIDGNAFIDESSLTGESLPIEKQRGDNVTAGTLNQSGYLLMRVTETGDQTVLARIIKLVDEATSSKAPIARLADKISAIFVPVVIFIAVVASIIWLAAGKSVEFSLSIGIAVLVISCPCALGLATPTAIMVGTGRGATKGILFKSASVIETLQKTDVVALDKTGTLTEGKPVVTDLILQDADDERTLLTIAASLEHLSEHPLAKAILQKAQQQNITRSNVTHFKQIPGEGISGIIGGERCFAGNSKLLSAKKIVMKKEIKQSLVTLEQQGKTVLYFVRASTLLGMIAVADVMKKNSRLAVAELQAMGLDVIMLTGDNQRTAVAIQQQAGIKHMMAEILPQHKAQHIERLQQQGQNVAMIGDGINDAPALATADTGIAIGAGTDIAIESASVVLIKSDLLDAVVAIQLSKSVMRHIRQNLFWAFCYNTAGIPIAAGVFYVKWGVMLNPMIAAAAMSLSSVCVVLNALRLKWFEPKWYIDHKVAHLAEEYAIKCEDRSNTMLIKKILHIEGMHCGHCSARVTDILTKITGVNQVHVDLTIKTAIVTVEDDVINETLSQSITDAGYTVVGIDEKTHHY